MFNDLKEQKHKRLSANHIIVYKEQPQVPTSKLLEFKRKSKLLNEVYIVKLLCSYSVLSHSVLSDSATPWTVVHEAPLSMGFSRQMGCHTLLQELHSYAAVINSKTTNKSWLKTQHSINKDYDIWSHHFMANRWGNNGNSDRLFFGAPRSLQMVTAAMKLKDTCSLEEKL